MSWRKSYWREEDHITRLKTVYHIPREPSHGSGGCPVFQGSRGNSLEGLEKKGRVSTSLFVSWIEHD